MSSSKRWGLYPWFEEHGTSLIHPDDLGVVKSLAPYGKVLRIFGEKDGFVRLGYGEIEFRAQPTLLTEVDAEVHDVGETVALKDGKTGEVVDIQWHHRRAEPMYHLRVEGKKKSKRYWNSDLASP